MSEQNDAPLVVTIKAGPGYEAPWVVVRGDNPDQVNGRLLALGQQNADGYSTLDLVTQVSNGLLKQYQAERTGATGAVQRVEQAVQADPAQTNVVQGDFGRAPQAEAPGPQCQHGERVHRTGNGAKGPWGAWFCPTPKGTPDQCAPIWDKK